MLGPEQLKVKLAVGVEFGGGLGSVVTRCESLAQPPWLSVTVSVTA
jgi:hypothetical protein